MKKTSTIQKILVLPLVAFALFFSMGTPKAEALFVPVIDPTLIGVEEIHNTFQDLIKMAMDAASFAVSQLTLTKLVQNTVAWAKTGNNGNPFYASPYGSYTALSSGVAGTFSNQIRDSTNIANFGPSFQNNLANQLSLKAPVDSDAQFAARIQDPYARVGLDAQSCNTNFSWDCFYTSLNDSGNPYGVTIMTAEQLRLKQEEAAKIQQEQLANSRGFYHVVDTNDCNYPVGMSTDFTGVDYSAVENLQQIYCKVKTPGVIVEENLVNAVNTDTPRINQADNMNKLISAVITSLASTITSGIF